MNIQRPLIEQQIVPFPLVVGVVPTPIKQGASVNDKITAFVVSVPAGATSVYLGGPAVSTAPGGGVEITGGIPVLFSIEQTRQLYELQWGVDNIARQCVPGMPHEAIPVLVWNLANIYLVSAAGQTVTILPFGSPYL